MLGIIYVPLLDPRKIFRNQDNVVDYLGRWRDK